MTAKEIVANWTNGLQGIDYLPVVSLSPWRVSIGRQQDASELEAYLDAVMSNGGPFDTALEIGLYQGGTHLTWKQLYKKVVSIECNPSSISFFGCQLKDKTGSVFVWADSTKPQTRVLVQKNFPAPFDMLFIDGNHGKEAVEADWINYEPLVREGGIIGFHDYFLGGVKQVVNDLREGAWGKKLDIKTIEKKCGIAWYRKE